MLALTLDVGESILIGDNVYVTYARRKGRHMVLSVNAPREIPVKRLRSDGTVPVRLQKDAGGNTGAVATGGNQVLGGVVPSASAPISMQRGTAEWCPPDDPA